MKICVVCRRVNQMGGISRYVYEICDYLGRHGHSVDLYTGFPAEFSPESRITVHIVPMIKALFWERMRMNAIAKVFQISTFSVLSRLMIRRDLYDIVHVQGDSLAAADVRSMHSCHRAWLDYIRKKQHSLRAKVMKSALNPLHFLALLIERYDVLYSRRLIAVSNTTASEISSFYPVDRRKIATVYNGVDLERFNPAKKTAFRNEIRCRLGLTENVCVLLFVGHEFERKGLSIVLSIMEQLHEKIRPALVVIGGDRIEPYKQRVADSATLAGNVIFLGPCPDVERYYAAADFFILPASYEPFGLVVFEAMAAGLPVIVSNNAGAAEVIENGRNGFSVCLDDFQRKVSDVIESLMASTPEREKLSINARATAERHSWGAMCEATVSVYNEIINENKKQ